MGLFSALSGKIYRFNSINTPVDNGIYAKIKGLGETDEKYLITMSFVITQEVVMGMFNPDHGIFRNSLDLLTKEKLEKIYFVLIETAINQIRELPIYKTFKIGDENIINNLAKTLNLSENISPSFNSDEKKANSTVLDAYQNIFSIIGFGKENESQNAILFGALFIKIFSKSITEFSNAASGN